MLRAACALGAGRRPRRLRVDLGEVTFFDCSAIGEFVGARTSMTDRKGAFSLRNVSESGVRLLRIVGLEDLIEPDPPAPLTDQPVAEDHVVTTRYDAWARACANHPTMSSPIVLERAGDVVANIARALAPPPATIDLRALPQSSASPVTPTLVVAQLLVLRRVTREWFERVPRPSRLDQADGPPADALDAVMVDMIAQVIAPLERAAFVDGLTGLLNRRAADRDVAQVLAGSRRSGRPLTVVMVDVVDLKGTNDRLGHAAGDQVLRDAAVGLATALRSGDNAYRVGGDEFLLLLPDLEVKDVVDVVGRTTVGERSAFTWGSAEWPTDGDDAATLLLLADRRLLEQRADVAVLGNSTSGQVRGSGNESVTASRTDATEQADSLRHDGRQRLVIEQAKGAIAHHFGISIAMASRRLSTYAGHDHRTVGHVAAGVMDSTIDVDELKGERITSSRPESSAQDRLVQRRGS